MAGCDALIVMILLSLSQFFGDFAYAGFYNPNILDLAPPFAGTLFGMKRKWGVGWFCIGVDDTLIKNSDKQQPL